MTPADYVQEVKRTAGKHLTVEVANWGLYEESGEVVGLVKKHVGHGHPLDPVKVALEVGDTCWYVVAQCLVLDYDEVEIEAAIAHGVLGTHYDALPLKALATELANRTHMLRTDPNFFRVVDVLRVLRSFCRAAGTTIEQALEQNVAKLRRRYPAGFSTAASIARVDVGEAAP